MKGVMPSRVVVVSDFSTVRGGNSKLAILHANLLAERNVPVTFFTGDEGKAALDHVDLVALGGDSLLKINKVSAAVNGLWNQKAVRALQRWISENDDERTVYHVHGYSQTLSPSILSALVPVRQRTFLHAHEYFMSCPNGAFFDYRAEQICERVPMSGACISRNCDKRSYSQKLWRVTRQLVQNHSLRSLFTEATTILIHSEMEAKLSAGRDLGHVVTVANPAEAILDGTHKAELHNAFYFVGDIHTFKGVFLLAEAGRRAGIPIHFIGTGADLKRLRKAYPEHHYHGWQNREGLAELLASARCVVAPSLGPEPYGLAPVEALLSGIPAVMADKMLLSKDIETYDMGMTFPTGNIDALSAGLRRLADDDQLVEHFVRNANSFARRIALSPNAWCDALLSLYSDGFAKSPKI
jgi:glycosyltransferase involved in cell wall biosynthesis